MKKIGNTSFNEEAVKNMTLKQFIKTYEELLKGQNLEEVYNQLKGKSPNS